MFREKSPAKLSGQNIREIIRKNKINFFGLMVLFIIFISIIITANYYSLTGLYLLDQKEVLGAPITVNSTSFLEFELEGGPESLSLSGYLGGGRAVRVYLANTGSLVLDSSHLSSLTFDGVCGEACFLENISSKIKLFIEIEGQDTFLVLESLEYSTKNHIPAWAGKTEFVVSPGDSITVDLSLFVEDVDGNEIVYSATENKDVDVAVSGSKLRIAPKAGFNSTTKLTVVASDMKETLRQDIMIKVKPVSAKEAMLANSYLKIDGEIIDEIEVGGSSNVIVLLKDDYTGMQAMERLVKEDIKEFKGSLNLRDKDTFGITAEDDGWINKEYINFKALSLKITGGGFEKLKQNNLVEGIFKDRKLKIALQESIPLIKADLLNSFIPWNSTRASVCVLDTGIDYNHGLFAESVRGGYDFINSRDYALDDNNHGTHVSGIIKSTAQKSNIVPVKVCDKNGGCSSSDILAGLDYCISKKNELNIGVISGSLGDGLEHSTACYGALDPALKRAVQSNIIPIFASGNEGYEHGINYPACSQYTISVGSITKNNTVSSFTNLPVDVLAPGENINSSIINGYGFMSGTSMAAAHTAGVAAMLKQANDLIGRKEASLLFASSTALVSSYPVLDSTVAYAGGDEAGGNFSIAATEISDCGTTIDSAGEYEVGNYLSTSGTTDCITVSANDVLIDCLGNHIVSAGTGEAFSSTTTRQNVTVKNCFISGFNYGVFSAFSNLTVLNTTFNGTKSYGVYLTGGSAANLSYNTFKYMPAASSYAVYFGTSQHNGFILNNTIIENKKGGMSLSANNHLVYDNYIDMGNSSSAYAFYLGGVDSTFSNNTIANLPASGYGFFLGSSSVVRNTLQGNNFVNGTNVSERWRYNKDHILIEGVNWTEPNYFSSYQVIAVDGYNLTINRSAFSRHVTALYIEGVNATLVYASNISSSNTNIEIEDGFNTTIKSSDLRNSGAQAILLDASNSTYIIDNNISFSANGLATDNKLENIYVFGNFLNGTSGDALVIGEAAQSNPASFLNATGNVIVNSNGDGIVVSMLSSGTGQGHVSYNNITVKGNGVWVGENVPNVRIEYNNITGLNAAAGSGIVCSGCLDGIFVDNNISTFQYGVEFSLGSGSSTRPAGSNVSNNNITDSIEYGIYFATSSTSTTMRNFVSDNSINNDKKQYHYWAYSNISITDFEIVKNKTVYPGIITIADSKSVNITNMNISSNITAAGIWLVNVTNATIGNNTFRNTSYGIGLESSAANLAGGVSNVSIIKNWFYGLKNHGIYDNTGGYGRNLTFYNNSILWGDGSDYGIYVATGATRAGNYNISANNISYGWLYGIFENGIDYNTINDNYLFDIRTYGIYITGENNTVRNNTIINVNNIASSACIYIKNTGAKYNLIEHNYLENCSRGIEWSSTGANNSAYNNTIYNSSQYGLYMEPSVRQQRIYQNTICHNKNGLYFTGGATNISSVDFKGNYFCLVNLYPAEGGEVSENLPWFDFNVTNLFNRSTTNCTASVDGIDYGANTTIGVEHDNQTILSNTTILHGTYSLNYSCQDSYSNSLLTNSITFTSTFNNLPTHTTPLINSSDSTNNTLANITVYNQSTADADGDAVKNIFNWHRNGTSIAVINLPFEGGSKSGNASGVPNGTKDYSGYWNNGTIFNATWNSSGGFDSMGAYQFDGVSDYINLGNPGSLQIGNNSQTISVWVKWYDTEYTQYIYSTRDDNAGELSLALIASSGRPQAVIGTDSQQSASDNLVQGAWTHVAVAYNGTQIDYYINGVYVSGDASITGSWNTSVEKQIGTRKDNLTFTFNGTIDEVMVFNKSLTAGQIYALYENKTSTIVSSETAVSDKWYAQVTPNDGVGDGTVLGSVNLTVLREAVACGSEITEDETLTANLSTTSECLIVNQNSITLDCAGYAITGNGSGTGIILNQTLGSVVKNCVIHNLTYGVLMNNSNHSWVHNNSIFNNTYQGIFVFKSSSNNFTVNLLANSTATPQVTTAGDGMYSVESNYNNYTGNFFQDNFRYGLNLEQSNYTMIVNNDAVRNGLSAGFYEQSSFNNSYTDNHAVYNRDGFSIYLSNYTTLTSNHANHSSRYGFYFLTTSPVFAYQNMVFNNTNYGIYLQDAQNIIIRDFIIKNNSVEGLTVWQSLNITIINNTILNNSRGLYIYDSQAVVENITSINLATDIKLESIPSDSGGIAIRDSYIENYTFTSAKFSIENSSAGKLQFLQDQNVTEAGDNLMEDIKITNNYIFVNVSAHPGLNVSANLTLYNIYNTTPMPFYDLNDDGTYAYCDSATCANLSYADNSTFIFNATHFTSFRAEENVPPSVLAPSFTVSGPYYEGTSIIATVAYSDIEGDAGTVYFKWYGNGAVIFTETETSVVNGTNASSTLSASNFAVGHVIIVEAWLSDGSANSTHINSSQISISTPPEIPGSGGRTSIATSYYNPEYGRISEDLFKLFDIILLYADTPVEAGDFLDFTYFIKAMTRLSDDIEISYWLESVDSKEKVIEGSYVAYFGDYEGKTLDSRLYLPKKLEGMYYLYVQAGYKEARVKAKTPAEVVEQTPPKLDLIFLDKESKQTDNSIAFSFIAKSNKDSTLPVTINETLAKKEGVVWQNTRNILLENTQRFDEQIINIPPDDYELRIILLHNALEQAKIIRSISIRAPVLEKPQPVGPKLIFPAIIFLILLAIIGSLAFLVPIIREVKFERRFPMLRRPIFFTRRPAIFHKRLEKKIDRSNKRSYNRLISFSSDLRMSKTDLSGEFDKKINKLNQKVHSKFEENRFKKELTHAREKIAKDIERMERRHHKRHKK